VWALIVLGLGGLVVSAAAFAGAAGVALAIYALAWRSGLSGYRFVLIGIGFQFMATGALGYMLTRGEVRDAQSAMVWLVGSLSGSRWEDVAVVAACLAVLLPLTAVLASRLRVLQLGDDAATALGLRTEQARLGIILVAVTLAAVGTAAAGPLAFVAFVSAPIARRLIRTGSVALVPTALVGILVVSASDFAALHLLPGGAQVPVGVITGVIGAPYLLWLLAVSGRGGRLA
jgi:iron complex transport system permease protein